MKLAFTSGFCVKFKITYTGRSGLNVPETGEEGEGKGEGWRCEDVALFSQFLNMFETVLSFGGLSRFCELKNLEAA